MAVSNLHELLYYCMSIYIFICISTYVWMKYNDLTVGLHPHWD